MKAKLFLNRAMDDSFERPFDERTLWASLALELLGKAALAKVSPVLIAEPNSEGKHLLASVGLVESEGTFLTVGAKTVFMRCSRAFGPFDNYKAQRIARNRNEYLHSGGMGTAIPPRLWWPEYWSLASILVSAQDRTLEDLVGTSRVRGVEEQLEKNKKYIEERVESLLNRARVRHQQERSGEISTRTLKSWKTFDQKRWDLQYSGPTTCPACGGQAMLEGEQVENIRIEDGFWLPLDEQTSEFHGTALGDVIADHLFCPACQFELDSYELIEATELDPWFEVEDSEFAYKLEEQEYGND
ncbi:hypothetical protein [Citricoccus alkalitolerans]|uniref:Uncharacterized protein n=1 Tax=Citricoccus alkalitolerans TaxID=246603 RepID=A0ABV8Y5F5_9MICC